LLGGQAGPPLREAAAVPVLPDRGEDVLIPQIVLAVVARFLGQVGRLRRADRPVRAFEPRAEVDVEFGVPPLPHDLADFDQAAGATDTQVPAARAAYALCHALTPAGLRPPPPAGSHAARQGRAARGDQ